MKKLIKKNNKSVSKFQQGGLFFTESAHPKRTWVNAVEARKRGIPLTADPRDPNAQWTYSYDILDPTPGTRPNSIDEHPVVNPESVYFLYDPNTGKILNQEAGIIDSAQGLVPLDESWAYHPRVGWFQPNANGGEVTNPDIEMTRNFLGNTLGWEQAYRLPPDAVGSMGEATTGAMIQGGAGVLGGEVLGAAANLVKPIGNFAPRVITGGATVVAPAVSGAVEARQNVLNNPIGGYLSQIKSFGSRDYDQLVEKLGEENAKKEMLNWLSSNGYNIIDNDDGTISVEKGFYIHPDEGPVMDYMMGPGNMVAAAAIGKAMYNNKKARTREGKGSLWRDSEGKRTKLGVAKNAVGWALNAAAYGGMQYWWLNQHKLDKKASELIDQLVKHGVITPKSIVNYQVQTDLNNNPQIINTTPSQMQDSAATPTPYNEYQGEVYDQNGTQVNPDYVGFETDTASNE